MSDHISRCVPGYYVFTKLEGWGCKSEGRENAYVCGEKETHFYVRNADIFADMPVSTD